MLLAPGMVAGSSQASSGQEAASSILRQSLLATKGRHMRADWHLRWDNNRHWRVGDPWRWVAYDLRTCRHWPSVADHSMLMADHGVKAAAILYFCSKPRPSV